MQFFFCNNGSQSISETELSTSSLSPSHLLHSFTLPWHGFISMYAHLLFYFYSQIADGLKNFLDHSGQICLNTPAGDYGLNATLPADTETTPVMVLADATNNTIVSASLSAGGGNPTNITFENLNVGCLEVNKK